MTARRVALPSTTVVSSPFLRFLRMSSRQSFLLLAASALLAACGGADAAVAPVTPVDPPPLADVTTIRATSEMVLEDSLTGTMIAYSHRDHWHGFPVVPSRGALAVRLWFSNETRDADDHDIPARRSWFRLDRLPDHNVRVVIADTTMARWSGTASGGRFEGVRENSASLVTFVVRRGTTTLNERPPLNMVIR
jgi:hypothetical protein